MIIPEEVEIQLPLHFLNKKKRRKVMDEMRIVSQFATSMLAKMIKKGIANAGLNVDGVTIRDIHITSDKDSNFNIHLNTDVKLSKEQVEALVSRFI